MAVNDARGFSLNADTDAPVAVRPFAPVEGQSSSPLDISHMVSGQENRNSPWQSYVLYVPRRYLTDSALTFMHFDTSNARAKAVAALLQLLVAQVVERDDLEADADAGGAPGDAEDGAGVRRQSSCVRLYCQPWFVPGGKATNTIDGFYFFYYEREPARPVIDKYKHIHRSLLHFVRDLTTEPQSVINGLYLRRTVAGTAAAGGGHAGGQIAQNRQREAELLPARQRAWQYLLAGMGDLNKYMGTIKAYDLALTFDAHTHTVINLESSNSCYSLNKVLVPFRAISLHFKEMMGAKPRTPEGFVIDHMTVRKMFYYRPPVDNPARLSCIDERGFVAEWFRHHAPTMRVGRGKDEIEDNHFSEADTLRPIPCDSQNTVCIRKGHVHPLENTWAQTAMPHLSSSTLFDTPEYTEFRRSYLDQRLLEAGFDQEEGDSDDEVKAPEVKEEHIRDAFDSLSRIQRGNLSFGNFLHWCLYQKERTQLNNRTSRMAVYREFKTLFTSDNRIGNTMRAVGQWHTTQLDRHLEPDGFARFFALSQTNAVSGLISNYLANQMVIINDGFQLPNAQMAFLLGLLTACAACIPDNHRTQPRLLFPGPKSTGKSHFLKMLVSTLIDESVRTYSYESQKAGLATHHDGGFLKLVDDATPMHFGIKKLPAQKPFDIYKCAKGELDAQQDEGAGAFLSSCTSIYQKTSTASVESGRRDVMDANNIKFGWMAFAMNFVPECLLPAILDRCIRIPVMPLARSSPNDPTSFLLAKKRNQHREAFDAMQKPFVERARRDQSFHAQMNLLAESGALTRPNLSWAASFFDAFLRNFQMDNGYEIRRNRAVDLVMQVTHVLVQKQALLAYDMGLLRPDASEPFTFAHLDGLSYFMVAGLDAILPAIELTNVLLDDSVLATCRLLYIFDRETREEDKRRNRRSDYVGYPQAFRDLDDRKSQSAYHRFESFTHQLLSYQDESEFGSRMDQSFLAGCLGTLALECFVIPGASDAKPRQPGWILGTDRQPLLIHRRVLQLGRPGADPYRSVFESTIPMDYPHHTVVRGRLNADFSNLETFEVQHVAESNPLVRRYLQNTARSMNLEEGQHLTLAEAKLAEGAIGIEARRNERLSQRILVSNPNYLGAHKLKLIESSDPSAAFRIRCSGVLNQSPRDEITYAALRDITADHLRSLGMPDSDIAQFAAMPGNMQHCVDDYAKFCDGMNRLREALMQSAERVQAHQLDTLRKLKRQMKALRNAVADASTLFQQMWARFMFHGSCMFWTLTEVAGPRPGDEEEDIPRGELISIHGVADEALYSPHDEELPTQLAPFHLGNGYRMSEAHVWFYLRTYFPDPLHSTQGVESWSGRDSYARCMLGDLSTRWRDLAWVTMQVKNRPERLCADPQLIRWSANAFTQHWFAHIVEAIPAVSWTSVCAPLPSFAEPQFQSNKRSRNEAPAQVAAQDLARGMAEQIRLWDQEAGLPVAAPAPIGPSEIDVADYENLLRYTAGLDEAGMFEEAGASDTHSENGLLSPPADAAGPSEDPADPSEDTAGPSDEPIVVPESPRPASRNRFTFYRPSLQRATSDNAEGFGVPVDVDVDMDPGADSD